MINLVRQVFPVLLLVFFTSCNTVMYVAVNNYGPEQPVTVRYNPAPDLLWESDTLYTGDLEAENFETIIVRTNVDSVTYRFTAPEYSHTELMPKAYENPIREISLTDKGRQLNIRLKDKEQVKKLKREGIIETSGMPENMILINVNKPEAGTEPAARPEETPVPEKGIEQAP